MKIIHILNFSKKSDTYYKVSLVFTSELLKTCSKFSLTSDLYEALLILSHTFSFTTRLYVQKYPMCKHSEQITGLLKTWNLKYDKTEHLPYIPLVNYQTEWTEKIPIQLEASTTYNEKLNIYVCSTADCKLFSSAHSNALFI